MSLMFTMDGSVLYTVYIKLLVEKYSATRTASFIYMYAAGYCVYLLYGDCMNNRVKSLHAALYIWQIHGSCTWSGGNN